MILPQNQEYHYLTMVTLAIIALVSHGQADVTIGTSTTSANYSAAAGTGTLIETADDDVSDIALVEIDTSFNLSGSDPRGSFSADFYAYIYHKQTLYSDQNFLKVNGFAESSLEATGTGTWDGVDSITGDIVSSSPGSESIVEFEVTGASEPAKLTVSILEAGTASVQLQMMVGGVWTVIEEVDNTTSAVSANLAPTLEVGSYRLLAAVAAEAEIGVVESEYARCDYQLEVGLAPGLLNLPSQGDYSYPEIGTDFKNSPKLKVVSPQILAEIDLGNGFTSVEVTANLVNTSLCPWSLVELSLKPAGLTQGSPIYFGEIDAQSTTAAPAGSTLTAEVENTNLAALRAGILDGSRFSTQAKELLVFRYPIIVVDEHMSDSLISSDDSVLSFKDSAGAQPGKILLEWEEYFRVPPELTTSGRLAQGFDSKLPFLVHRVDLISSEFPPGTFYEISGVQMILSDLVRHGTIQSTVTSGLPDESATATEGSGIDLQATFPVAHPIHFNQINLRDLVDISGNFGFARSEFGVETVMENGALKRFVVTVAYTADLNLLIETKGAADTTADPIVDKQETIFNFDLFTAVLPAGFTITPNLSLEVGAEVDVPQSLSIPMEAQFTVRMKAGVQDGVAFYEDSTETTPLQLSDPGMFERLGASASAWANAEVYIALGLPGSTIRTGPTFGAKATSVFEVTPLGTPWWSLEGDLDLTAGIELDLAGFITLIDESTSIQNYPLFDIDSQGGAQAKSANPGIRPSDGKNTRWARILQNSTVMSANTGTLFAERMIGSGDLLVGSGTSFGSDISRIAPNGELLWTAIDTDGDVAPIDCVAEADGGFTLLGGTLQKVSLTRFDPDGGVIWSHTLDNVSFPLHKSVALTRSEAGYFVVGETNNGTSQCSLFHFDNSGAVVWQKLYSIDGQPTYPAKGLVLTGDGGLVFCATSHADVTPGGSPADSNLIFINITPNGLVVKVDAATGDLIWSHLLPQANNSEYRCITQDPGGNLYLGGTGGGTFLVKDPRAMVLKLNPDGTPVETILFGHAGSPNAAAFQPGSDLFDDIPHGGESYYDVVNDMVWADGALWAGGKIGLYNSAATFVDGTSAFTARIDTGLNVSRFAIHAGPSADSISQMLATPTGPVAIGTSTSFLPWPNGSSGEADNTPNARLIMRLPWEGLMRFHPISTGAQPEEGEPADRGSYFVYPRIMSGNLNGTYALVETFSNGDEQSTNLFTPSLTITDLAFTPSTTTPEIEFVEPIAYHALEFVPESIITNRQTYYDWHQMEPSEDPDNDGTTTAEEYFYGTDPTSADTSGPILTIDDDTATITVPRSPMASAELAEIQDSGDLETWFTREDLTLTTTTLPDGSDLLEFEFPLDTEHDRRFFRLLVPE